MIVEILEDELIPLPEGATLVSLPFTRPIGIDAAQAKCSRCPVITGRWCFAAARLYTSCFQAM